MSMFRSFPPTHTIKQAQQYARVAIKINRHDDAIVFCSSTSGTSNIKLTTTLYYKDGSRKQHIILLS